MRSFLMVIFCQPWQRDCHSKILWFFPPSIQRSLIIQFSLM